MLAFYHMQHKMLCFNWNYCLQISFFYLNKSSTSLWNNCANIKSFLNAITRPKQTNLCDPNLKKNNLKIEGFEVPKRVSVCLLWCEPNKQVKCEYFSILDLKTWVVLPLQFLKLSSVDLGAINLSIIQQLNKLKSTEWPHGCIQNVYVPNNPTWPIRTVWGKVGST